MEQKSCGGDSTALMDELGVTSIEASSLQEKLIQERLSKLETKTSGSGVQSKFEALEKEISTLEEVLSDLNNAEDGDKENLLRGSLTQRLKSLNEEKEKVQKSWKIAVNSKKKSNSKIIFEDNTLDSALNARTSLLENERDKLIRTGILTPFDKMEGFERKRKGGGTDIDDNTRKKFSNLSRKAALRATRKPSAVRLDDSEVPERKIFKTSNTAFHFRRKRMNSNRNANRSLVKDPMLRQKWQKLGRRNQYEECVSGSGDSASEDEEIEEYVGFDGGFSIQESLWNKLFDYQRTGVKWLWELHCQGAGGIMGDEMGLGKTLQVIAFLSGLLESDMYNPSIVVCPVTLMSHWARELKRWAPKFKVGILHDSALSFDNKTMKRGQTREEMHYEVVDSVLSCKSGILVTSYEQLRIKQEYLLKIQWGYAVLDEGHKIRNPNIELTLVCKQLSTPHRVIMTGAPIQNRLVEIWSLFDFVFPGKLGTLPVFNTEFSIPIQMGGYAHASKLQISTAYKCAIVLRDLINPYLLRRRKVDVNIQLPKKSEHVLFCLLTKEQQQLYKEYLSSHEVQAIFEGKVDALAGIDVMKKICNHPHLLDYHNNEGMTDIVRPSDSGKMTVLMKVLEKWSLDGHKTLLFSQTRQMLDIIELVLKSKEYNFLRMDGTTPIQHRQSLVDKFNESKEINVFCLTTRVGGLGLNLTGANRVILYDPDWNPSTDLQAQERAWRIGQKNEVIVYRLVTSGTIEEKIYNRQIFKQFLTNKILQDPKQRRAFQNEDIQELFVLGDEYNEGNNNSLKQLTDLETNLMPDEVACDNIDSEAKDGGGRGDATILKSLMQGEGVTKAICHDKVMSANASSSLGYDRKASELAEKAAAAIKKSQRECSVHDICKPTWTGSAGAAGAPKPRFGKVSNSWLGFKTNKSQTISTLNAGAGNGFVSSSRQLLSHLKARQEDTENYSEEDYEAKVLTKEIILFLKENGGSVTTPHLVESFRNHSSGNPQLFKLLLKQVAVKSVKKEGDGLRSWTLRPDFL